MTSPNSTLAYSPDYASPPGDLVQEYLDHLGISARELARRCGRSGKLIAEIVSGKAPLEPETALQLERVLDVPAAVWSNMEAAYQLHQAKTLESQDLAASHAWFKAFPLADLADRGYSRLVFPEGTRAPDGKIAPFKPGIGLLARELGLPVVPVYLDGLYGILPKGRTLPRPGPVRVIVGEPLRIGTTLSNVEAAASLEASLRALEPPPR